MKPDVDMTYNFLGALERAGVLKPDPQAIVDEFSVQSVADRLDGEEDERAELTARAIAYGVTFLDDCLRAMLPHDLVLLGAYAGAGKTQMAMSIAASNAAAGRRVTLFALEAESREIERRLLYRRLQILLFRGGYPSLHYVDWFMGRGGDHVPALTRIAREQVASEMATLSTFYMGSKFTADDMRRMFQREAGRSDLLVLDHLHYVDSDDANESRAQKHAMETIRNTSIEIGIPVLCVAHLRKRQLQGKYTPPVPSLDDFHGSSDVVKIATHAVMIARADREDGEPEFLIPSYMHIPKDRRSGATGLVARVTFDLRANAFSAGYRLGRIKEFQWEELPLGDAPSWAAGARS